MTEKSLETKSLPDENGTNEEQTDKNDVENNASENISGWSIYVRVLKHSDKWDWILNGVGCVAAIASGAALGKLIPAFEPLTIDAASQREIGQSQYDSELSLTYRSFDQCSLRWVCYSNPRLFSGRRPERFRETSQQICV